MKNSIKPMMAMKKLPGKPKSKMTSKARVSSIDFGNNPNEDIVSKFKQKTIAKTNSKGESYFQKQKLIGYQTDSSGKKSNPTITKIKSDESGKEIKRITKPVSMGRAERNVKRVVSDRKINKLKNK